MRLSEPSAAVTFLFTDIEGSTRLWEQHTDRMRQALALHDELARSAVRRFGGHLVKSTGDGIHAAFGDALDALSAALQLQQALADPAATGGLALVVRCGLHAGGVEARDNDYFGPEVNRAARIMSVAHGGQVLLSQAVADAVAARLPPGLALRDLGAARLRDLSRPERLWQLLAPPLRVDFPALRSLGATPNNLPQQLNRFIGREAVLPELRGWLGRHRLVTLLGTGGIGKSRLAVQLGAELLDEQPDGVWFVELAPVTDAQRVPQALASVLGLKETPGQPLDDALDAFVRERRALIILDNCEHLLAASAALAKRLLRASPGLQLMATSREPLRVAGEAVYPVPVLSAPDPAARSSPEQLMQHAAVQLFADRASAVQPQFRLGAANAAAVAQICHRLDGIPLAIELAAARARSLPLDVMARRLVDSFRLVTTTDETVAPRQRTLHRLIDWSHDLLASDEQRLFHRLSVFAGGWTLESAEAVCADDPLDAEGVVDLLAQLVDKSLVVLDVEQGTGQARYRLLETVRQYAAEKLAAEPDAEPGGGDSPTRQRHLRYFLDLAEQARAQGNGPDPAAWLLRLDAERDNLLAAHAAGLALAGGAPLALQLSFALRNYWLNRGLLSMGLDLLQRALDHGELQARDAQRARGLFEAGHLSNFLGRHALARSALQESLSIIQAVGDLARVAVVLQPLGVAHAGLGDLDQALACLEAAVSAARQIDRPDQLSASLVALGHLHQRRQALDAAEPLYREALAIARAGDDAVAVSTTLVNLGMVALVRGQHPQSQALLAEALGIARRSGAMMLVLGVLDLGFGLAVALEQWSWAERLRAAAQACCRRSGFQRDAVDDAFLQPWLVRLQQAGPIAPAGRADDDEPVEAVLEALAEVLPGLQD